MSLGLVLGGGGARGAAHIGVLYELERLGVQPDLIVGTSIGGLIAALLGFGMTPEGLLNFFRAMQPSTLIGLPGKRTPAMVNNHKFEQLLESWIGRPTFAELHRPVAMVATDLVSQQSVVLDEGDVISAILATTAIPILLPPVERDGRVLVDGGILNNVPFDVARQRGAERVIAVNVMHGAPYGTSEKPPKSKGLVPRALDKYQRQPLFQVLSSVADIITSGTMEAKMNATPPDLMLDPQLGTIGLMDFHRVEDGIEAGRKAARAMLQELETFA